MARTFTTFDLALKDYALAFPLIQAMVPGITLDSWLAYATAGPSVEHGIVALRSDAKYICGLFLYRIAADLIDGKIFTVDLFVTLDLLREEFAFDALHQIAEARAIELKCNQMEIRVRQNQSLLGQRLQKSGHDPRWQLFCKRIEQPRLAS